MWYNITGWKAIYQPKPKLIFKVAFICHSVSQQTTNFKSGCWNRIRSCRKALSLVQIIRQPDEASEVPYGSRSPDKTYFSHYILNQHFFQ